jgi:hypothetical protein
MNIAKYNSSIATVEKILKDLKLFSDRINYANYKGMEPSILRPLSYRGQWRKCIENRWYNIRLVDQSFFQFKIEPNVSYSFYECPLNVKSIEEFAIENFGEKWELFTHEINEEYAQYVETSDIIRPITLLRYDFHPDLYGECHHPAAHMHFGIDNNIRVAVVKLMNPISFVLFVIRQWYPREWLGFMEMSSFSEIAREIRDGLDDIPEVYWSKNDKNQLYLY